MKHVRKTLKRKGGNNCNVDKTQCLSIDEYTKRMNCECPPECYKGFDKTSEYTKCLNSVQKPAPPPSARSKSKTPSPTNHTRDYLEQSTGARLPRLHRTTPSRKGGKKSKRVRSIWKWW